MKLDIRAYNTMLGQSNVNVIYSGPIWSGGIDGIAEMLQRKLDFDAVPLRASQSVFSVFVEQMNNMLMYSAEKELFVKDGDGENGAPRGIFVLGVSDKHYFVHTGNVVTDSSAAILKTKIDHINTLDKQSLRQYYKDRVRQDNPNPQSRGAGLGLIEIARRAAGKIEYEFTPHGDGLQYFTMYVVI